MGTLFRMFRTRLWKKLRWIVYPAMVVFIIGGSSFVYLAWNLPSIESLKEFRPPVASEVYSHDMVKIGEFFRQRRVYLPLAQMPPAMIKAFISAEDAEFFEHGGISFAGIFRAMVKNVLAGRVRQGGSTITQQVAKSLLLSPERSYTRKAKEAVLAYKMERFLSKEEILEIYLNQVYLGHGAYGVQAASQIYFNKDAASLSLAEIAMLAGLTKAPSRDNPFRSLDRAQSRQSYVLSRLQAEGYISKAQYLQEIERPLSLVRNAQLNLRYAPYFVEHVRRYVMEKYGEALVLEGGLQIYTTLEARNARSARKALRKGLEALDRRQGFRGPLNQITEEAFPEYLEVLRSERGPGELEVDHNYRALVTQVDDKNLQTHVNLGRLKGIIPLDVMTWAREPNADQYWKRGLIEKPSQALSVGDVVLVRPLKSSEIQTDEKPLTEGELFFELIQEPEVQGALVGIDPRDGGIRAMVGGYDFEKSEFNRVTQAARQPGSAFKPLIYTAAIDHGYTAASMLLDSPIVYDDPITALTWKPKNFGGKFYGNTVFREALIKSRNVPTVRIVQDIGIDVVLDYASRFGIASPLARDHSLALGSSAVKPLELVSAYTVFAASGRRLPPAAIEKIVDRDGNVLERNIPDGLTLPLDFELELLEQKEREKQTFDLAVQRGMEDSADLPSSFAVRPQTAYIMTHLLKEVISIGTGRRAQSINRPAAGKTGTTNDNHDAWFVGFTPSLVTGVWVGFDQAEKLGVLEVGGSAASPIWLDFMKKALEEEPIMDFSVPPGVVFAQIDPKSGKIASRETKHPVFEAFLEGTEPEETSEDVDRSKTPQQFFLNE